MRELFHFEANPIARLIGADYADNIALIARKPFDHESHEPQGLISLVRAFPGQIAFLIVSGVGLVFNSRRPAGMSGGT